MLLSDYQQHQFVISCSLRLVPICDGAGQTETLLNMARRKGHLPENQAETEGPWPSVPSISSWPFVCLQKSKKNFRHDDRNKLAAPQSKKLGALGEELLPLLGFLGFGSSCHEDSNSEIIGSFGSVSDSATGTVKRPKCER